MRRRSRRAPNFSESTGKIGQELPANQPAPLVPSYPDPVPGGAQSPPAQIPRGKPARPAHPLPQPGLIRNRSRARARPGRRNPIGMQPPPPVASSSKPSRKSRPSLRPKPNPPIAPPQAPKGYVVLAIGLPGSGKTTWFRRRGVTPLSSDLLRNILFDDVEEQRYQGLVFSTLRSLLRARLIARMPWNYVDATNLSHHERRQWIKMSTSFGYEVQAVFFDVPLEVCLERNRSRDRSVSEEVMRKMAEKLKPPAFEEGFSKITVVRVKSAG